MRCKALDTKFTPKTRRHPSVPDQDALHLNSTQTPALTHTIIGDVAIRNVHGWNVGGHLVVHNGIVGAYLYEDGRGYSGTLELVT